MNRYLLLLFLIGFLTTNAQDSYQTFGETSFTLSYPVSGIYSHKNIFRSRYFLDNNKTLDYRQQQVDFFHFSNFNLNPRNILGLSFYYRNRVFFDTGSDEFRLTEEFNHKNKKGRLSLTHRFRSEQRFFEEVTSFRQRYRLSLKFPFGKASKTYFWGSLEGLLSSQELKTTLFDKRTISQIGISVSKNLKLQTGVEYRLESFNVEGQNNLYILTSASLKI